MDFEANYLGFEIPEIIEFLLKATSQKNRDSLNPEDILSYLKLISLSIDFKQELPSCAKESRALLSYPEKIIAVDSTLHQIRQRFSLLHEIGHYVLPNHIYGLYLCSKEDLSWNSEKSFEKEANDFAANLLFMGNRFILEANSSDISAETIKQLSHKYNASFECTARHFVENTFHPCMFISFTSQIRRNLEPDSWAIRYCIGSPSFKSKFFHSINGCAPREIVSDLVHAGRDIADGIKKEVVIKSATSNQLYTMGIEYFYNQYNILALVTPSKSNCL